MFTPFSRRMGNSVVAQILVGDAPAAFKKTCTSLLALAAKSEDESRAERAEERRKRHRRLFYALPSPDPVTGRSKNVELAERDNRVRTNPSPAADYRRRRSVARRAQARARSRVRPGKLAAELAAKGKRISTTE